MKGSARRSVASSVRAVPRWLSCCWLVCGCATAGAPSPRLAVVDARWCIGGSELTATGWSVPYAAERLFEPAHDRFEGRAALHLVRRDIRRGRLVAASRRIRDQGDRGHAYAAALGYTALGDATFGDPRTRDGACRNYRWAMGQLVVGFFSRFHAGSSPDAALTSYLGYMLAWCGAALPLGERGRGRFEVAPWDAHLVSFVVAIRSSIREVRFSEQHAGLHALYEHTLERVFTRVPEDRAACARGVGTGRPVDCTALGFGQWDAASLCGR